MELELGRCETCRRDQLVNRNLVAYRDRPAARCFSCGHLIPEETVRPTTVEELAARREARLAA